jgi:hypothetical protein
MPSSRPQQRIPVLTWHGYNVFGDRYDNNDLIAFAADLRVIDDADAGGAAGRGGALGARRAQ